MLKPAIFPWLILPIAQYFTLIQPASTRSAFERTDAFSINSRITKLTAPIALGRKSPSRSREPRIGVVKTMVMGDAMCYVEIADLKGKIHRLGADFGICAHARKYLRKKVRIYYKNLRVNDCPNAEFCGKTKVVNAIYKLRPTK